MIKVSVIIPVYNVEKYLEKCLDSVINQTLKEIEIICIDDCSSDSSYSILERYSHKDSRIVVLKNEINKGSGRTRNIGINIAKGEYIAFIDSDDFVDSKYLELLYHTGNKFDADLINTESIYFCNENDSIEELDLNNNFSFKEGVRNMDTSSLLNKLRKSTLEYTLGWYACCKIWKLSFLLKNKLEFLNINNSEDFYFLFMALAHNPTTAYNGSAKYYYVQRESSLSKKGAKESTLDNARNNLPILINYYNGCPNHYKLNIINFICSYLFYLYKDTKDITSYKLLIDTINIISENTKLFTTNLFLKKYFSKNGILKNYDSFVFYNEFYSGTIRKLLSHSLLEFFKKLDFIP
ncbi:glycosyltransferase family 2 protein [Brachyspira pulli]|uniref:glycosyltransferase family 2 protein n=1 Tax=Brachyspira pulli TaxID=310721 RepID=UPI0030053CED